MHSGVDRLCYCGLGDPIPLAGHFKVPTWTILGGPRCLQHAQAKQPAQPTRTHGNCPASQPGQPKARCLLAQMRQTGPPANDFVCPTATFLLRSLYLLCPNSLFMPQPPSHQEKERHPRTTHYPPLITCTYLPDCHIADYSSCLAYAFRKLLEASFDFLPFHPSLFHPTLEAGPVSTSDFARPHLPTEDSRAIDQAAVPVNRDDTRPKVHS